MTQPFERQTPDIIGPNERLRPLRDGILLEPLDFQPSHVIELVRFGRPLRGIVRAVGPGRYEKIWLYQTNPQTGQRERCGYKDTMTFIPTSVKEGDVVELGGLNIYDGEGYKFDDVMVNGKLHLLCHEQDVCGVDDGASA